MNAPGERVDVQHHDPVLPVRTVPLVLTIEVNPCRDLVEEAENVSSIGIPKVEDEDGGQPASRGAGRHGLGEYFEVPSNRPSGVEVERRVEEARADRREECCPHTARSLAQIRLLVAWRSCEALIVASLPYKGVRVTLISLSLPSPFSSVKRSQPRQRPSAAHRQAQDTTQACRER